jgi:hypothetical protein
MTIETSELNGMRDSFALASEDGQRINSSDSCTLVVVVSEKRKAELLNLLEARFDGKERRLDECIEKCFLDGLTAQLRSVEYSRKTKRNAEIAELARDHKGSAEELIASIRRIEERDK